MQELKDESVLEIDNKSKKRKIYHSKYTNPESGESDDETATIRNPPASEVIFPRHIDVRNGRYSGGVVYWE